jgi:hypothetical protein
MNAVVDLGFQAIKNVPDEFFLLSMQIEKLIETEIKK